MAKAVLMMWQKAIGFARKLMATGLASSMILIYETRDKLTDNKIPLL